MEAVGGGIEAAVHAAGTRGEMLCELVAVCDVGDQAAGLEVVEQRRAHRRQYNG